MKIVIGYKGDRTLFSFSINSVYYKIEVKKNEQIQILKMVKGAHKYSVALPTHSFIYFTLGVN